ncbi:hypothetical protein ASPCADRAFT_207602 [Aspergillus carbonarius ITEM 5010]|uniref:Uncharacterized protein n=1 Tax=Aspergillus carbonarius (strain ITEM 5010) TaxID=602072 RepID=A0A1R3RKT2_ASPC5|nr:hypothetical protein ASPCADRAFT_207602 [Aspergillus carbonarius ITEM 5010]
MGNPTTSVRAVGGHWAERRQALASFSLLRCWTAGLMTPSSNQEEAPKPPRNPTISSSELTKAPHSAFETNPKPVPTAGKGRYCSSVTA